MWLMTTTGPSGVVPGHDVPCRFHAPHPAGARHRAPPATRLREREA